MKQALQPLMLARCSRCGTCFDLQYDLASLGADDRVVTQLGKAAHLAARATLCWKCRL
ncbi:MAG: hypothetical protein AABX53_02495 [Nanoarchaeota archaeon]